LKNVKCVVGATLLTPVALALIAVVVLLLSYGLSFVPVWIVLPFVGIGVVVLAVLCWFILFEHCKNG
jgi:hypothetical protein